MKCVVSWNHRNTKAPQSAAAAPQQRHSSTEAALQQQHSSTKTVPERHINPTTAPEQRQSATAASEAIMLKQYHNTAVRQQSTAAPKRQSKTEDLCGPSVTPLWLIGDFSVASVASVAPLGSSVTGSSAPSRLGAWLVFLDYRHVQEGFKNIMEMCSEDMEVFFFHHRITR